MMRPEFGRFLQPRSARCLSQLSYRSFRLARRDGGREKGPREVLGREGGRETEGPGKGLGREGGSETQGLREGLGREGCREEKTDMMVAGMGGGRGGGTVFHRSSPADAKLIRRFLFR